MTADPAIYALPQTMRVEECHALDQFLRQNGDQAIRIDGHQVEKIGGLAAQLIVAHQNLRGDAAPISITTPSSALTEAMGILGLSDVFGVNGGPV
ncbi:hypothetical protein [Yoonia sp.]|uniref:hypothetical protein n=1 Tax=Yoonia sp. TaxID=2212373 RepID=UPI0035C7FD87